MILNCDSHYVQDLFYTADMWILCFSTALKLGNFTLSTLFKTIHLIQCESKIPKCKQKILNNSMISYSRMIVYLVISFSQVTGEGSAGESNVAAKSSEFHSP